MTSIRTAAAWLAALAVSLPALPAAAADELSGCPMAARSGVVDGAIDGLGDLFGMVREWVAVAGPGHDVPSTPPCLAESRGGKATRALSYNVKAGRDSSLEKIAEEIRAVAADVVALQEVDVGTGRTGRVDQPAELARRTGLRHHAFGKAIDHDGGDYGVALLSRWPIENVEQILLPGDGEQRTVLCGTVKAPSGDMRVCSTHLGLTDGARGLQAAEILSFLEERGGSDGRVVLMGDFNAAPDSTTARTFLDAGFSDAYAEAEDDAGFTHPSGRPTRRIDLMLTGSGFTATCADVPRVTGSDHRPVFATLR